MVSEPAQSTISTFAAGLSAGALALFGVTYLGMLWALIGALTALMFAEQQNRGKALASVVGGMFVGAVMSDLLMYMIDAQATSKLASATHLGIAFIGGAGSKRILSAAIDAVVNRIRLFGGKSD